jgi:hypothetical protein
MRAKHIALTSTVKIELADGRGREAFCFPNTATISPPSPLKLGHAYDCVFNFIYNVYANVNQNQQKNSQPFKRALVKIP